MKEQILQMKELLCESINGKCNGYCENCNCEKQAEALYKAGYRKKSEVIDEFAERLKNYPIDNLEKSLQISDIIDEIATKMKGGAE